VFVAMGGKLFALDPRSSPPRLLGQLDLTGYGSQLLLKGDKLLVLGGYSYNYPTPVAQGAPDGGPRMASFAPTYFDPTSKIAEVDVSDPAKMRVLRSFELDGQYVNARLNGSAARVVISTTPPIYQEQHEDIQGAVQESRTGSWRPGWVVRRGRKGKARHSAAVRCRAVRRPDGFSGLNMLTVLTIDMAKGLPPVDSDAVMTNGQLVYSSASALFVATQYGDVTGIHAFDAMETDTTTYRGSGEVAGYPLNQFAFSEDKGFLRVATTKGDESAVHVLDSKLKEVGSAGGLGKGERIYAVRFIGDRGYVVTFRQIDPLYVLDLSKPADPKVTGELKIQGYSAYLHPVGDDLLLGIGQDANEQGRTNGAQLSLFDVSDPANPQRIQQHKLSQGSSSDAEYDHHAFLFWEKTNLAVLPVYEGEFNGAVGFKVLRTGIDEAGRVNRAGVQRSLVVGDRLLTVAYDGLGANDLATFKDEGFTAFPFPPPQPQPQPAPAEGQPAPATTPSTTPSR
jgi:hypothetical protein